MIGNELLVTPNGISVFGSAVVRVVPDIAVLTFSVSRMKPHQKEAFQAVREAAQQIQSFLSKAHVKDAGSSNISLREEIHRRYGGRELDRSPIHQRRRRTHAD